MPKALESSVDLYVSLKDRKALQNLLDGRKSTYSGFEHLNSSKRILDELAEEIEIIEAGLDTIGDDAKETQPSEVMVTGIVVSGSPAAVHVSAPPQILKSYRATSAVVVTGLSISASPPPVETDLSSLPRGRVSTDDS